ncbi:MAG: cytochrome b/b6 domain-containing protein [Microbacteriaceae bacterium]
MLPTNRWARVGLLAACAVALLAMAVFFAQWLRTLEGVGQFLTDFPGASDLPEGAPVGLPAWLGWQHFVNSLFLLLIIRTGWLIRSVQRQTVFWTRNNSGVIRTKNPPRRISLTLWLHLSLDALWVLNGLVFVVLLFSTGQWMRIVPTDWDIFPNAVSAALQYASLDWPSENGWVNYNALQVLAYFVTVFVAAPLAIVSGIRLSPAWPGRSQRLRKFYPVQWATAVHFPVMIWFVGFTIVHVTLVFATGALRNLNHMYAGRDADDWVGFFIFAASLVVMIGVWAAARPVVLRTIAGLGGTVSR